MGEVQSPVAEDSGLTQLQRLGSTFAAPSRTFADIKRGNRSWWLPFIVVALAGYVFFAVVQQKIGIEQVVANQMRMNSRAQEQLAQATPEQRAKVMRFTTQITEGAFWGEPLIGLAAAALVALGLLGTINFGFGGRATFGQVFAVVNYAWLPNLVKIFLGIAVIYAGMEPGSFNPKNFAPTNLGAFLNPVDTNHALYTLVSSLDIVTIWTLVLMSMGVATVAGVKRSSGYIAVFAWWALIVLIGVGVAAASS